MAVKGGARGKKKASAQRKPARLSKLSSKRKLSRLGKVRKQGEAGTSTAYVSRSTAMKRLQLTLRDFRRLCILKGVYPRDVAKLSGKFDSKQTYYSVKDVAALAREPLLDKFREFKTSMRKVRRSAGRGEIDEARRRFERAPKYTLHQIIKERYPRFEDALHDMDDSLSMIALFASLPAFGRVDADVVARCSALEARWHTWILKTKALTKAFVSIKGVYLEVRCRSARVVWLVPHRFAAAPPDKRDVDYRVMLTFLELYEVLVKFVLHKLYSDDAHLLAADDYPRDGVFKGLVFAFSREAIYPWLDLVAKCGGATVLSTDGQTADETPTHVVSDRPSCPTVRHDNADLVQPQWIVDSFNAGILLPVHKYAPGADLPPHLSPFAGDDYVPAYRTEIDNLKSAYAGLTQTNQPPPEPTHVPAPPDDRLATVVMSKKAKRLHGRMLYGIQRKREVIDKLRARRAKLEEARAAAAAN